MRAGKINRCRILRSAYLSFLADLIDLSPLIACRNRFGTTLASLLLPLLQVVSDQHGTRRFLLSNLAGEHWHVAADGPGDRSMTWSEHQS